MLLSLKGSLAAWQRGARLAAWGEPRSWRSASLPKTTGPATRLAAAAVSRQSLRPISCSLSARRAADRKCSFALPLQPNRPGGVTVRSTQRGPIGGIFRAPGGLTSAFEAQTSPAAISSGCPPTPSLGTNTVGRWGRMIDAGGTWTIILGARGMAFDFQLLFPQTLAVVPAQPLVVSGPCPT